MAYTKQTWANDEAGGTPLAATRLNNMEDGIFNAASVADTAKATADSAAAAAVTAQSTADSKADPTQTFDTKTLALAAVAADTIADGEWVIIKDPLS